MYFRKADWMNVVQGMSVLDVLLSFAQFARSSTVCCRPKVTMADKVIATLIQISLFSKLGWRLCHVFDSFGVYWARGGSGHVRCVQCRYQFGI